MPSWRWLNQPSPGCVRVRPRLLLQSLLPFRAPSSSTAALAFRREQPPTRVSALPRHHTRGVHSCGFPTPLRSVLRCSQPLDGLLRPMARGLLSSHNRVQDPSRSGVCPPRTAVLPHRKDSCPLAVGADLLTHTGSHPRECPQARLLDFEALLRARAPVLRFGR
jgi:hypothetical protein